MADDGARYLVARVGDQRVAWAMTSVKEIIPVRPLTRLPGAPTWVGGLLNLRGTVLTVVDLAARLGLEAASATSVVVLEVGGRLLGAQVHAVESVTATKDPQVEPVEPARAAEGLAVGMVRVNGGTAVLLDAEALLRTVLATA